MSSKDQNKKNPGRGRGNQNYRGSSKKGENQSAGKPNQSRGNQNAKSPGYMPPTGNSKKQQSNNQGSHDNHSKGGGSKEDNFKGKPNTNFPRKNQPDNTGMSKELQQTLTQKKTSIKIGLNNSQHLMKSTTNMLTNKSESPGFLQLAMNALSHLTLNIESTSFEASKTSSHFSAHKEGKTNFQVLNRGNRRGFRRNAAGFGGPGRFKSPEAPVQLRVHTGHQEAMAGTDKNFRPRFNAPRNRFGRPGPNNRSYTPMSKTQFMSPNPSIPSKNFSPLPSYDSSNVAFRQPAPQKSRPRSNIQETNSQHFDVPYNHTSNNHFAGSEQYNTGSANIFSYTKAPIFKTAKMKSPVEKLNKTANVGRQGSVESTVKPKNRHRKKQNFPKKSNLNSACKTASPLLSFQRILPAQPSRRKGSFSSDENDRMSLSRCSSDESVWTTTVSDGEGSSDESEATSEVSMNSSLRDSGVASNASESGFSLASNSYKSIAYYWDIENCPVPRQKSPTDFVKRVRERFSNGRSEFEFTAVCDVTKLNEIVAEELDRASVNIMHVSYVSKNAADTKIKSLLQEFPDKCRSSGDYAVVLISGDSDFANTLNNLKYKYHVFVYLIHKSDARYSLVEASDEHYIYENFVQDLPIRSTENKKSYVIFLQNFPTEMKNKQIKKFVNDKMKGLNFRIKLLDGRAAEIHFPNKTLQEKALPFFNNLILDGNKIAVTLFENETLYSPKIRDNNGDSSITMESNNDSIKKSPSHKNITTTTKANKDEPMKKGAILCVHVSVKPGNAMFWKSEFQKLWSLTEFELQWENRDDGYFLVKFTSLSQAQKAKKLLQKAQSKNTNAPRFLKLIKQDNISINLSNADIQDTIELKVQDQIRIIESKKEFCLNKLKDCVLSLKSKAGNSVTVKSEAIVEKCNELNEQKVMFLHFYSSILDKIKKLKVSCPTIHEDLALILQDYKRECNLFTSFLPIYGKKNFILKKIKKYPIIQIQAETGFGKSTQLAQYIWQDESICKNGVVICTQPHKIAVVSIAKHVSSQIGCSLGDIVDYQIDSIHKRSPKTKILYVSHDVMLKILTNDDLENVSCIIVDDVHERTFHTDLLLGMLKKVCCFKPELKLVITSTSLNDSFLIKYFSLQNDSVLELSCKKFPVEDIWRDQDTYKSWDYFAEVIKMVDNIMVSEIEGGILAYLTSAFETEKAQKIFVNMLTEQKKSNVQVFQLHDQLAVTEFQKLFSRNTNGIRKIVFSTNFSETSAIPGIKFVVDCGLVRKSQFDFDLKKMVSSVDFISENCVKRRKCHIGKADNGNFFHLYSQADFGRMPHKDSEVLYLDPSNILFTLIKLGRNPIEFEFPESPPSDALKSAKDQLTQLEIIEEDMTLTNLGKDLSCLPLEPKLGLLILKGIEIGVGFEAVVIASSITVSKKHFLQIPDIKSGVDFKKIRICQNASDFITYLELFKEWAGVPKLAKNKWCALNGINAQSMHLTQDLVNDVMRVLSKEAHIKIAPKFNVSSIQEKLLKIIFHIFYQSLCIYSGYPKYGYKSLDVPGNLLIHPSSPSSRENPPMFLVYESILKTDATYLINISPVTDEMLLKFESESGCSLKLEELLALPLQKYTISPVGKTILLHDIIGKECIQKKNIESSLKRLTGSDSVAVDVNIQNGEILIYAPQSNEETVESVITPLVTKAQVRLLEEEKEILVFPQLTAVMIAGADIKDLIFPGEFRNLKLILTNQTILENALEKLQTCGTVSTVTQFKNYFKITYISPSEACLALQCFEKENSFSLQEIMKSNAFGDEAECYKIQVSFLRRKCTGMAFVAIEPVTAATEVVHHFQIKGTTYRNASINFSINDRTRDIVIKGLPKDTEQYDLMEFLKSHLLGEYQITKCVVLRDPEYESNNKDYDSTKQKLLELFSKFSSRKQLSIRLKKASPKDFKWHAFVFFQNCQDGETAFVALKNQKIVSDIIGLTLKPILQSFLFTKLKVFSAVKTQVEKALEPFKSSTSASTNFEVTVVPKGEDHVQMQIMSCSVSDITEAKSAIAKILLGDQTFDCNNPSSEKLLSKEGQVFLKGILDDKPNCHIEINKEKNLITIFGNVMDCDEIKGKMYGFSQNMGEHEIIAINLLTEQKKPGLLRALFTSYGIDLKKLEEISCAQSIDVDLQDYVLFVTGSSSSLSACQNIVQALKETLEDVSYDENDEICPICLLKVANQFHRLEYCGHAYCKDCLLHLFLNANNYPLHCSSCDASIILQDFQWAVKEAKVSETEIFRKPLQIFLQNRSDIGYCPSPDCSMIFRISDEDKVFECLACSNFICTRCCEFNHYGMNCTSYRLSKGTEDVASGGWMMENPNSRKLCPCCSTPVERSGGSKQIMCWKCKEYFCWSCDTIFLTSELAFNHQAKCPRAAFTDSLI